MDAAAFEQVYGSFRDFHAYYAPLFGRRETREHSGHYLQALLVQSGERRNAENLSETVPGSARGMQRFLTDSPWDDEVIIGRLQEYLGTRLEHPEGVWVLDGSDFPKQGRKSVGVARQYCGRLGKVANCQAGMFLAYVSPLGRALVDKGLYLPESWTSDKDRCEAAGVPEDRQGYRSKTELALEMAGRAQERGHLKVPLGSLPFILVVNKQWGCESGGKTIGPKGPIGSRPPLRGPCARKMYHSEFNEPARAFSVRCGHIR